MSVSYIKPRIQIILWGNACGRCQYEGCPAILSRDPLTKAVFNSAYIAHIIADKPNGPRGDKILSKKLCSDLSNLMLLCDVHHRLVDKVDVAGHSAERLREMKFKQEERMRLLTSIAPNKQSHILMYGAKVGNIDSPLHFQEAMWAMTPEWYPADDKPISLGVKGGSWDDKDENFWKIEPDHLTASFKKDVEPRLRDGSVRHLSVFSIAPQPLLIQLGTLLTDIVSVEVYQRQREPQPSWKWQPSSSVEHIVRDATKRGNKVALNLSLSATIDESRITNVLGDDVSIWTVTIEIPNNNYLKSRDQLKDFREKMRLMFDRIKSVHGQDAELHIFPAAPVAINVELGRVWQPKADMKMHIYDQHSAMGGFTRAITISNEIGKNKRKVA